MSRRNPLIPSVSQVIEGYMNTYGKGDRYCILEGVVHSGKIYKGHADIKYTAAPKRDSTKREAS